MASSCCAVGRVLVAVDIGHRFAPVPMRSALLLAVEMDRVEVVELLMNAGADVGVLKPNGASRTDTRR
eukprot:scaffold8660_cov81-Phaeocystis_antarctica.AAC.3